MKYFAFVVLLSLSISGAYANECNSSGKKLSEDWVRFWVHQQYGQGIKIEARTESYTDTFYFKDERCIHETLYMFEIIDPVTGGFKKFIGRSVMDNNGLRPFYPYLNEVRTL